MSWKIERSGLYGNSLKREKVAAFVLSERRYSAFFKTPSHAHESSLFCLVLDGSYTEFSGRKEHICRPSTFLFHAAGATHEEHFHASGGHSFIVEVASDTDTLFGEVINCTNGSMTFATGNIPNLGKKLYSEFKRSDRFSSLIIEGLIYELVGEIARQNSSLSLSGPPIWLRSAEELIRDRFAENLTLAEISAAANVHPVHLAQAFRRHYHNTVGGFQRSLRLENACRDLKISEKSIAEIALNNGYCDQSHFTRAFRREFGVTPGEFRQNI